MMQESTATQPSAAPLVYLVVLNWNGWSDTHECLLSLQKLAYPHYKVLVIDNASSDDSPQRIADSHPEIDLVACRENKGIASGYNRGIEAALARQAEYIVVMNNDLICDPLFVTHMVAAQQAWPNCGIVMPKIYYYDDPERIWSAGAYSRMLPSNIILRGRQQKDGAAFRQTLPIDFAPSCCLLLTRKLCEQIVFDERFFFYFDDWDFCLQARNIGQQLIFAADAHIWHKISRSTQNSTKPLRWWKVLGQSCVRYHRKHHSNPLLAAYVAWVLLREAVKGNFKSLPAFLSGIRDGLQAPTIEDRRPGWSNQG
jgi:GT2 family glycosyltransferase